MYIWTLILLWTPLIKLNTIIFNLIYQYFSMWFKNLIPSQCMDYTYINLIIKSMSQYMYLSLLTKKFQHHLYDSHLQKPWLKMEFIFSLPGVYLDWWSPGGLYRTRPPPACSWPGSAPQGPSWHWVGWSATCHRGCKAPGTPGTSPGQCSPPRNGHRSSQTGCLWNNGMYFGQLCLSKFIFTVYSL